VGHQWELVQEGAELGPRRVGEVRPVPRGLILDDCTQLVHPPAGRWFRNRGRERSEPGTRRRNAADKRRTQNTSDWGGTASPDR
jgi:hypothetical protein